MITLSLDITKECNLQCKYCGAMEGCGGSSHDYKGEIDTDEIKSLLWMAKQVGCRILTIGGGEPLLRKDLLEVLRYASGLEYVSGLVTNGTLITDEVARELSKCGVSYVRVSMESADKDRFEEYRGKDVFEKVKQALYNLKKHGLMLGVGATIYPQNASGIDDLIDFCLAHQVDFIRVVPGLRIGLAKDLPLDFSFYVDLIDRLQSVTRRKFINKMSGFEPIPANPYEYLVCPCSGGQYTYYINPVGEVKMCPFVDSDPELERYRVDNEGNKFEVMKNSMEKLMNHLPQAIGGKCASCELLYSCRGGCLATKLHSGLNIYDEQPLCVKELLSEVVSRNIWQDDFRKVVGHWLHKAVMHRNKGIPLCIRRLPVWMINLSSLTT